MFRRSFCRFNPVQGGGISATGTTFVASTAGAQLNTAPISSLSATQNSATETTTTSATFQPVSAMKVDVPAAPSNGPANPFSQANIMSQLHEAHNKTFQHQMELKEINEPKSAALNTLVPSPSENSATAQPFAGMQLKRFFRFDQAFNEKTSKDDLVLSTEESHGVFTFNTFKNITDKQTLARALLSIPMHLRRYHCVTGIMSQPIDFYADMDIPRDLTSMLPLEKLLKMVIHITHDKLKDIKLIAQHTLLLESKGAKHFSFHLHIRCENGVFEDFAVLRPLADEVNAEFARQIKAVYDKKEVAVPDELSTFQPLDTAVYRRCGQVRLGHCVKIARPEAPLSCFVPEDAGLKSLVQSTLDMTIVEHMAMSIPLRLSTEQYGITIKQGKTHAVNGAGIGRKIPPRMHESKKADRFRDVLAQMRKYPPEFAREYHSWVCVGCALYSFGPEFRDQGLDAWMSFSRRCGEKFKPTAVRRYWDHSFRGGANGTAIDDNWQRGYYYLVSTIYGQSLKQNKVKIAAPSNNSTPSAAKPGSSISEL